MRVRSIKIDREQGGKIAKSVLLFTLCYLLIMAIVFLMVVLNDPTGWVQFLTGNVARIVSLVVCVALLCAIIYYYYYFEDREFLFASRNVFLIFTVIAVSLVLCYLFGRFVNVYARPFALLALVFVFLFQRSQAIMLNFVFSLLIFLVDIFTNNFTNDTANFMYYTLVLGFVCGTVAIFLGGGVKTRGGLLGVGFVVAVPTVMVIFLLELTSLPLGFTQIIGKAGWGVLGCVLSSILTMTLLPFFEGAFSQLTVFRLRELTRPDAPLLRRLKTEAPGTFNHSLIVAQLAETCAIALGENSELARAAAYYHDVGKLKQPECFTENQSGYNIHDELTPELSADIIRSHVKDGYDLITAHRLPLLFAEVALEHHGSLPIKYFYAKASRISGGDVNVREYSYLAPTPSSRIAAIVMIADSSEAAVRSMNDRSPDAVEKVIRSIIEERIDLDQFVNCDITMRDLTTLKQTLVAALSGVHHHRVKYPALKFHRGGTSEG